MILDRSRYQCGIVPVQLLINSIGVFLATFVFVSHALADGVYFSAAATALQEPNQQAVIHWDDTTETMILASAVKSEHISDFAWVVPIRSRVKPAVTPGEIGVFEALVECFRDAAERLPGTAVAPVTDLGGVWVIETKKIDLYDITILGASDAGGLVNWLLRNGYNVSGRARSILTRYVSEGDCYFVANKINLTERFDRELRALRKIEAGLLARKTHARGMRPSELARAIARLVAGGGDSLTRKSDEDVRTLEAIGQDLLALAAAFESEGSHIDSVASLGRCLDALRLGLSTPLQFAFQPPEPYFPLGISSVNGGETNIVVYFIEEHAVFDINDMLKVDVILPLDDQIRAKLSRYLPLGDSKHVTRLYYSGRLDRLTKDATF